MNHESDINDSKSQIGEPSAEGAGSVHQIRVDPLSGSKSIIASVRAVRPGGGFRVDPAAPIDPDADPFMEGHEDRTPPEVYAVRHSNSAADGPGWRIRVVPNLYPAITADAAEPTPHTNPDLFTAQSANGVHEVIINAPEPVCCLADLPIEQFEIAVQAWRDRMRIHSSAAYVHTIVNERTEGGASIPHTHAQLYAFPFVPPSVARERERFTAYAAHTLGGNLLDDLIKEEVRQGERIVAIDDEAVLLAPYASRVPFQLVLAPRRSSPRFEDDTAGASLLHAGLMKLRRLFGVSPPLNLWVRTAPSGAEHFTWHIDIWPRLTNLTGLELGAELNLCVLSPEDAAAQLRDA